MAEVFPDIKDNIINIYPASDSHVIVDFIATGTVQASTVSRKFSYPQDIF